MDADVLKKSALIIATLNSFITPFMGSAVNSAFPAIKKELHTLFRWHFFVHGKGKTEKRLR